MHGAARLPCGPGERPEAAAEPEAIYVPVATQPHRPHLWSRRAHAWGQVVQRGGRASGPVRGTGLAAQSPREPRKEGETAGAVCFPGMGGEV